MIRSIKDSYGCKVVAGSTVVVPELKENEHIDLPIYLVMQLLEDKLTLYNVFTKRVRTINYPQTPFVYVDPFNMSEGAWYAMAKDIDAAVVFLKSKNLLN